VSLPLFDLVEPEFRLITATPEWVGVIKPRGVPSAPGPITPHLLQILEEMGYSGLRTIGRLDRPAGGVSILARTPESQRILTEFWHTSPTEKLYLAGTYAPPDPPEGQVILNIGPGRRYSTMRIGTGKHAETRYRLIGQSPKGFYWVLAWPLTGRRHQIRLHLGSRGAPIVGDTLYLPYFCRLFPERSLKYFPVLPSKPPEKIELYCLRIVIGELGINLQWEEGMKAIGGII
jgi:23S rRNA-/tRNA-specific pseudouridylate synthase